MPIVPVCQGCKKPASEIPEYQEALADYNDTLAPEYDKLTIEQYVASEEGTYNPANGHFLCTPCYIEAGCPSAPAPGWKCP